MKVLLVHNFYQQPGGEGQVFAVEGALLEARGHRVLRYTRHNDRIAEMSAPALVATTLWNWGAYREIRDLIRRERPQVVHVHNTFPLISPAVSYAARAEGLPVVQTLHNYRLFCLNSFFFRGGRVCQDCLRRVIPLPGVVHACYRRSRTASGAAALKLIVHRLLRTWQRTVDVYVTLNEFARLKFVEGGLPADRLVVKPNSLATDPGPGDGQGGFALFVGRLSPEKGLETLLAAWEQLGDRLPLKIVGDGPLAGAVEEASRRLPGVDWLGSQNRARVLGLMRRAVVLVVPSLWYEGCPMVVLEAYAAGLPVIGSELGGLAALIAPGRTGLHAEPGNAAHLAEQVEWLLVHPHELAAMRGHARAEFEARYTAERNYQALLSIYATAARRAQAAS